MTARRTFVAAGLALSASMAFAQQQESSTVLTLPFYGYDSVSIVGSVVSADKAATTLALACATMDSDCGLFPLQTLTFGPSTYNMDMSDGGFTGTQDCKTSVTPAVCMESASGSEANFPGSSTTTYAGTDVTSFPVTITAGLEKLGAAGAGKTTSGGSATSTDSASTGAAVTVLSGTAKATSTGSAGSSEGSSSTGSSTASTTASASAAASSGAAVVNGASGGVLGAAAAAVGCVAAILAF